jgi:hypothetical protein
MFRRNRQCISEPLFQLEGIYRAILSTSAVHHGEPIILKQGGSSSAYYYLPTTSWCEISRPALQAYAVFPFLDRPSCLGARLPRAF